MNLSEWAVRRRALMLFLMAALLLAGVQAWLRLGRAEDPSFTIKEMLVSATLPGADAETMTRQVTDRIERVLQQVPHFDFARSFTAPGSATLFVVLRDDTPPGAVADAWYQVRKKLADAAGTFPAGMRGPYFNDEFGDVFGSIYAFRAEDGWSDGELRRVVEDARDRVLRLADVSKAEMLGVQPQRIWVEFSHVRLAALGLRPADLFASLARQNAIAPAGSIDTPTDRIYLRVDGGYGGIEGIADTPVQSGGRVFRLGDVALVRRGTADPKVSETREDGKPVVQLAVSMARGGDLLRLGDRLTAEMDRIRADLPAGISVTQIADQPRIVRESITEFTHSLLEALGIVLAVSFLSLGARTGVVVALSVPLVLAITFVLMQLLGVDLHRISLGALIIALGLLVDDAIIASEMMVVKLEEGWTRLRAATFAYSSTAMPMLTGTLVTAIGFVPVGFARSASGEYAGGIFWVTATALLVSWLVAVLFTPVLGTMLLRERPATPGHHAHGGRVYRALRAVVGWCLDHRRVVVVATALLFVGSVAAFTKVQQQFFPTSSRLELMVDLTLREGASIAATEAQATALEQRLLLDTDVAGVSTYIGTGSPRFFLSLDQKMPSANFAQLVIRTRGLEERERLRSRLLAMFETDFPDVRGRVVRLELGPPVGYPVAFRVLGADADRVRAIAAELRDAMRASPQVRDVNLDWNELAPALRLQVDQDRLRLLGLTPADIAADLETLLSGRVLTQYREGTDSIDVVARAIPSERLDPGRIADLNVTTASGVAVPLAQVARLVPVLEEPKVWRRTRDAVITVRADVQDGLQAPDVTAAVLPLLRPVMDRLPAGYRIETGGAVEASAKSQASIQAAFPLMVALMLTVLMVQLQSIARVALVVLTAPLGLIGVSAALLLFQRPFGFVATLGVIALAGMIMRNSVILIDQIERDIADGHAAWDAVVDATVRRARPIVLTAAAAILAMVPLSRSVFWGPMAVAIMGGLLVATFLTLLYLPALYALWFGVRRERPAAAPAPSHGFPAE